jgi:hypothetical protein
MCGILAVRCSAAVTVCGLHYAYSTNKLIDAEPCVAVCCVLQEFLVSHDQPADLIADVCAVVASVGFKEELAKKDGSSSSLSREAAVVQDADRCVAHTSSVYSLSRVWCLLLCRGLGMSCMPETAATGM